MIGSFVFGALLCVLQKKDGTFNDVVHVREQCRPHECQLEATDFTPFQVGAPQTTTTTLPIPEDCP